MTNMTPINSTLTLRPLDGCDAAAVEHLAALDTKPAPDAPLLGAEVEGRLLAAVSIATGEAVADPFSRTAELRALLELRAAQLRERAPRMTGRMRRHHAADPAPFAGTVTALHPRAS